MKKRKDAFPFLTPVDPVLLGIPTYFEVITTPMDISTVEKKLKESTYKSIEEYKDDVLLIFANCVKFNGEEAQVSVMGKNLEKWFVKELEKLPTDLKDKKKKSSTPRPSPLVAPSSASRPRREVPSTPKEPFIVESLIRQNRKLTPEMKFAGQVLRDLMKKHYAPYNLPFLQPVDPDALGIPQYREIIKHPMDMATIKKKYDMSVYDTVNEFVADVRLMFQNCYTFNAPGSEVYNMGRELEGVFDKKWSERPGGPNHRPELDESHSKDKHSRRTSSSQHTLSYQDADLDLSDDDDGN
jgi:bromodomain-containing factor 1